MPIHPTAPGPSSAELKTRVANFMRRAEQILTHPLADHRPGISVTFRYDNEGNELGASMSYDNIALEPLVFLASCMRPIIFLRNDPISIENITGLIEREHAGFRGKIKPFRQGFVAWLETPIVYSGAIGEAQPELQSDNLQVQQFVSAPVGTPLPIEGLSSDMHFAQVFFNAEYWHSDVDKSAEYEAATANEKQFFAKCAEIRTFHAIKFVRILHGWVVEVRAKGMDI